MITPKELEHEVNAWLFMNHRPDEWLSATSIRLGLRDREGVHATGQAIGVACRALETEGLVKSIVIDLGNDQRRAYQHTGVWRQRS